MKRLILIRHAKSNLNQPLVSDHERILNWNDKSIAINWPDINLSYHLSEKDKNAPNLSEINQDDLF